MSEKNKEIKYHISIEERNKWDKVVTDFTAHMGAKGVQHHALGDGDIAGFSTNDYTNAEKAKLASVENGALNNPHPSSHPYTMIEGLSVVGHTGEYSDLLNIPKTFIAGGGNSDTVNNIRVSIQPAAPENPQNMKELWVDTSNKVTKIYINNSWQILGAGYL